MYFDMHIYRWIQISHNQNEEGILKAFWRLTHMLGRSGFFPRAVLSLVPSHTEMQNWIQN
jgi:hypothetical protein